MVSLEQLKKRLKNTLSKDRYEHSLRVSKLASEMAVFWQIDKEKAAIAGLLHDIARELPFSVMLDLLDTKKIKIAEGLKKTPVLLHAPLGAYILESEWGIKDEEILNAVSGHTLADESMSSLTKLIFLADMLEPGRKWQGIDEIQSLIYEDLDLAMLKSLECQLKWLNQENKYIHPSTYKAYQFFLDKNKKKQEGYFG